MFETYLAALKVAKLENPAYSYGLRGPLDSMGKVMRAVSLLAQYAPCAYGKNSYHANAERKSRDAEQPKQNRQRPMGSMPQAWTVWPLRPRVLHPDETAREPLLKPEGN